MRDRYTNECRCNMVLESRRIKYQEQVAGVEAVVLIVPPHEDNQNVGGSDPLNDDRIS